MMQINSKRLAISKKMLSAWIYSFITPLLLSQFPTNSVQQDVSGDDTDTLIRKLFPNEYYTCF